LYTDQTKGVPLSDNSRSKRSLSPKATTLEAKIGFSGKKISYPEEEDRSEEQTIALLTW
jgi:hypothetical protein